MGGSEEPLGSIGKLSGSPGEAWGCTGEGLEDSGSFGMFWGSPGEVLGGAGGLSGGSLRGGHRGSGGSVEALGELLGEWDEVGSLHGRPGMALWSC